MQLLSNPELIRNVRAQLRLDRMLSVAGICAVLSLVVGFSMASRGGWWGREFLQTVLWGQAFVLLIMGGLAALQTIQGEKTGNTFDFQRLTRLSPLELSVGKLLGAPILAYFIVLCLMPAAIVGVAAGPARLPFVLASYAVLILGAMTFHALALLFSMVIGRGAGTAAVLVFLLGFSGVAPQGSRVVLSLGPVSPYVAVQLADETTWALNPTAAAGYGAYTMTDLFFGWPVHHVPVLLVLYVTFALWFLLPVVRNLKRDPAVYEIFTPGQALGFGLYVNLIVAAFLRWLDFPSAATQAGWLTFNFMLFSWLGLALLRTRERVRWLHERGRNGTEWLATAWPAPYVLAGTLAVGLGVAATLSILPPRGDWDLGFGLLRLGFFALWSARDILFVQWMNLRGGRRPLLTSLLYLSVFYACVLLLEATLHLFQTQAGAAVATLLLPGSVLQLSPASWLDNRFLWVAALLVEAVCAGLLVTLQRRVLGDLAPRRPAAVPA